MIVYSHRFQGILQQVVLDLGLELTLLDESSPVSLADNEQMLTDLAAMMNIDLHKRASGSNSSYTFIKKK